MNDTFYFSHDFNSRNDPKMIKLSKLGWDLVGLFWAITEMLHEQKGYLEYDIDTIAFALRADTERIKLVIDSDLFIRDGNRFTSKRILDNLIKMKERSIKAKQSAEKRWNNAKAMRRQCEGNAIKENKIKEIKEINIYVSSFFDYYLQKTQKNFKLTPDKVELITKRLESGYTIDQLKKAVDNFILDDWEGRSQHLDLIYCIGKQKGKADNLERWLNYKPVEKKPEFIKPY